MMVTKITCMVTFLFIFFFHLLVNSSNDEIRIQQQRRKLTVSTSDNYLFGDEEVSDWTMRAALFTPFGLTPGTGERYLLECARWLVLMGYDVDIILFEDNPCFTAFCVEETLKNLRINLKFEDFRIRLIPEDASEYSKDGDIYDIFIGMGIKKVIHSFIF